MSTRERPEMGWALAPLQGIKTVPQGQPSGGSDPKRSVDGNGIALVLETNASRIGRKERSSTRVWVRI
jgi:hypothetical protein